MAGSSPARTVSISVLANASYPLHASSTFSSDIAYGVSLDGVLLSMRALLLLVQSGYFAGARGWE
jgi:hypothetical protein